MRFNVLTTSNEFNQDKDRICRLQKRSGPAEPFDLEAFFNSPKPKVFDPENVVRASEPFDVEFIRYTHEAREDRIESKRPVDDR